MRRNRIVILKQLAGGSRLLGLALSFVVCQLSFSPAGAQFQRRSVVEEYTGTWCENCPRGIVGMQRLADDFPDRFIGIAVHTGTGEPMLIPTYPEVQQMVIPGSGAPSCTIDRQAYSFDPYAGSGQRGHYHYGIDLDYAAALEQPTEALVQLTAEWDDDFQWDVRFNVTTTFSISSTAAPYRLAFVLVEDGLTGTTDDWLQVNNVSLACDNTTGNSYRDDDMQPWRDAPYYVSGVAYNHVAVNTQGIKTGVQGSISAPITAYEPQTYTAVVTTLANHTQRLIQDKGQLHAVCMLLNTETGEVVNADQTSILPHGSLEQVATLHQSPFTLHPVHDLQGRRLLKEPAAGIYLKDGRKYIVK